MTEKPLLVFVSTRFLFPTDSGGKIRTTQVLRGLKGGAFRIRLLMPCSAGQKARFPAEVDSVCDELVSWEPVGTNGWLSGIKKIAWLLDRRPIPVVSDWNADVQALVARELARKPAVAVFDFPHSAVLAPAEFSCPVVMFTHNIEAEIFKRHVDVAKTFLHRWVWKNQYRKMLQFEKDVLHAFDATVAVSDRDCEFFRSDYGISNCRSIPTGVDTEFFRFNAPDDASQVVFCGSMDWMANIDGIEYFHSEVWPLIRAAEPSARMKVVGRRPPDTLVKSVASASPEWTFTGFVDDVRNHVSGAGVFVIPLRVGGGTRIKAFEAMAMGCPVVSTSIGVEGLPVEDGVHYLNADTAEGFAAAVVSLIQDSRRRQQIAVDARTIVEEEFGFRKAAAVFEDICLSVVPER